MAEEQNNYFSSTLIFKIVKAPPPASLPDLEIYFSTLSGREVKYFKNGANVDLFVADYSKEFFGKSTTSKSTFALFLKGIKYFISLISPLSIKRAFVLFFIDRGDK